MPTIHDHLSQADSNKQSAIDCQSTYPDWTVTKCFYAAIHYIEAYALYRRDDINTLYRHVDPSLHARRKHYLTDMAIENGWSEEFLISYSKLEKASKKARYLEKINTTAVRHFKIGSTYYIDLLQVINNTLNINSIKISISY